MIAIIDYGMGNLCSVQNGFAAAGIPAVVTDSSLDIKDAGGLVLPGVGAFGSAMEDLRRLQLDGLLLDRIKAGVPLLGICLGMQLLFDESEEKGQFQGLGVIPGDVSLFREDLKVPHIGWNNLLINYSHPLLAGINSGDYFYFVHSYYVRPQDEGNVMAGTLYGKKFPAVVQKENVFGIQFHPEKSGRLGINILHNFGGLVGKC